MPSWKRNTAKNRLSCKTHRIGRNYYVIYQFYFQRESIQYKLEVYIHGSVILHYRVDKSEKKRKELEHICNFNEEKIEKDERELSNAKKTTRDAYEKYEETTRRLHSKEKVR